MTARPLPAPGSPRTSRSTEQPTAASGAPDRTTDGDSAFEVRPDGRHWPTPATTLTIASTGDGELWAVPLASAEPAVLVAGRPVPTWGAGTARSRGGIELSCPQERARWATTVQSGLARPFRVVWGQPGGVPASWVPAWMLVHDDGTATVVDHLRTDALTSGTDLLPMAETAALVRARGWRYELVSGTDTSVDRDVLAEIVLDAPDGVISTELWGAAVMGAPLPELVDAITTPADLLWVRPYFLSCWAEQAARDEAEPPRLFPRP